ncbi:MAG: hypothetical protein LBP55_03105 [Candidatus Adiutrix sp.]|jgi:hypothetical protein|nr:hypothetical protein [Candidatus Adiutrix sp.]
MKIKPIFGLMALLLVVAGCQPEAPEAPMETPPPAATAPAEPPAGAAVFTATAEEATRLAQGQAVNALGTPNGIFTNPEGVSGYFQNYDQPFNFIWAGPTTEVKAFDGRTYKIVDGAGEMALKFQGDDLLLQRYQGEFKEGLWSGHGRYWLRNDDSPGGQNYLTYQGGFQHDQMDGRGVLTDYDFRARGGAHFRYDGQMRQGEFHGQGTLTDLATGAMTFKGLWFAGRPFAESRAEWQALEDERELKDVDRQFTDLLMTGQVEITGAINPEPGQGPLTIVAPEEMAHLSVSNPAGQAYPAGQIKHPTQKSQAGADTFAVGVVIDEPWSAYPLTLTISYELEGRPNFLRLTIKRPFILMLTEGATS